MPFIEGEQLRKDLAAFQVDPKTPGEACYLAYQTMLMDKWAENPCWTTAHRLYYTIRSYPFVDTETRCSFELAWQVFFQLHVMPYELEKRAQNGDITGKKTPTPLQEDIAKKSAEVKEQLTFHWPGESQSE